MSPEQQASKLFYKFKMLFNLKYDFLHLFNTINYSYRNPWIISVESAVPWTLEVSHCIELAKIDLSSLNENKEILKALKYLAAPNCKALLALSECSRKIQLEVLKQFPFYEKTIENKLVTLHPPQELIVNSMAEKQVNYSTERLKFIYIGRDFFRKGGRETIKVLSQLKDKFNFKLILISDLRIDESKYIIEDNEIQKTKILIETNSSWIDYYSGLPNDQVIQLIKEAHVALLPTWMDTYGFSVLECQACGCPVISTSLRALKEINSENVGWLIDVPVNRLNNPIHNTKDEIVLFRNKLEKGLYDCVFHVLTHQEEIKIKAEHCIEKIKNEHNPQKYQQALLLAYNKKI
jgi:glycosyltransferase involved in cell wall biosynthesis